MSLLILRGLFKAPPIGGRGTSHSLSRRKSLVGSQKVNRQEQDPDVKLQPRRAETFVSGYRRRRQSSLEPKNEKREEGIGNEKGGGGVGVDTTHSTQLSTPSSTPHRPIYTGDVDLASESPAHELDRQFDRLVARSSNLLFWSFGDHCPFHLAMCQHYQRVHVCLLCGN
ncbi:unnamed protein product [Rodentolepis nana]|uniref:DUF4187 domain-containing protein n=1 Tax=Rodentolepis nana TaxID=102285 RepID=A0A0R3TDG7_RODNA|nr:unnamed protein product [Rodentolepis nana]